MTSISVISTIVGKLDSLTPKGRIIGNFITQNPTKAVFMTVKEMAEACNTSEATVIRFVDSCGFNGYSELQQHLKEFLDTGLSLLDRADIQGISNPETNRLNNVVVDEMSSLQHLYENLDIGKVDQVVEMIAQSDTVYVTGSRLSYTFAYFLGWSMTRIRKGVHTLKGSDTTAMDTLANAPEGSLVILIATTRYPNELIRLARFIRREGHQLVVITDNTTCPMIQFSNHHILVPLNSIAFIGNTSNIMCVLKYVFQELAGRMGPALQEHQKMLEQHYLENDIWFNIQG